MPIKILGAGVSGLTAAINLAKAGKKVVVFEAKPSVGKRFNPNLQALFTAKSIHDFFEGVNLDVNFVSKVIRYTRFISTDNEDIVFDWHPIKISFILRGGSEGSIEEGLLSQAEALGVEFRFNERKKEEDGDIVATGPRLAHGAAYGASFRRGSKMKDDEMLVILTNKIALKGSYMYAVPNGEHIAIFYTGPACDIRQIKKYHQQGLQYFQGYYEGEHLRTIVGYGNFLNPKTASINGRLYLGEAAGFQDPFMGFGNHLSIKSGYLAAKSIIERLDYDKLWKEEFKLSIDAGLALRFFSSLLGDWFVFRVIKAFHEKTMEFQTVGSQNNEYRASYLARSFIWFFSRAERLKKMVIGRW